MIRLLIALLISTQIWAGIVAKVNGREITNEEFKEFYNAYRKEILHFAPGKPTPQDKREFLYMYIKAVVIEDIARQMGVRVGYWEVEEKLKEWGHRKSSQVVIDMARRELLLKKIYDIVTKDVEVDPGEVYAYYTLNKREFSYPNQIKLLRIVVSDKGLAEWVYSILKRGQKPASGGGVVVGRERWYSIQSLPKSVRRKLYPYKKGYVSKPIRIAGGYLLLKITDKKKGGVLPLEEVKEKVRKKLLRVKKEEVMNSWFREVIKRYKLDLYLENLE